MDSLKPHQSNLNRLVTIAVGAFVLYFAWMFFWRSGFFDVFVAPKPDIDGMVSVGASSASDFLGSAIELIAVVLSTVGSLTLTIMFGGIRYIVSAIAPLLKSNQEPAASPDPSVAAVKDQATESAMPPQMAQQVAKLLVQAAIDGDGPLVIALAERLHGEKFLVRAKPSTAPKNNED